MHSRKHGVNHDVIRYFLSIPQIDKRQDDAYRS